MIGVRLQEGYQYLLKIEYSIGEHKFRLAKFNGFDTGNMDWSGDSGSEHDQWMHEDVISFVPIENLSEIINLGILTKKGMMQ